MTMRTQLRTLAALPMLLALGGCLIDDDQTVIKLGHALDTSHSVHIAMQHMADRVAELSDGTMRIDIYPSQQLCSERECMELLQIGSLGIAKVSAATMENFAPSYQVLNLPFIFRDSEHKFRVLESPIGDSILLEGEPRRLLGLAWYDAGARSFYTKDRPIETPSDLAGKKIRVMESNTSMRMVRALGGSPTPISWGELYTALQQGVVDGAENNPPSFYLSRHYEVARYYSLNEHTMIPDVVVISTVIWNSLTPQQQEWLRLAARESAVLQKELWRESEEESLRAVEAAGVTILHPDKAPFAARVEEMLDGYRSQPELYSLIQQIRAM
jgi:tripartite ATP-independent transporter DctP family solute receptor